MAQARWLQDTPDGAFERKHSEFRHRIGEGPYTPEAGRYHLYVQYACPWAHRVIIHRKLLGLEDAISMDVVSWRMAGDGSWNFEPELDGCTPDTQLGSTSLQQIYRNTDPGFAGIGTVPVLWDKQTQTIVNNESREIIRMCNETLAPALGKARADTLLPDGLEADVDAMIDANYETVNNGVYKCGFARSQGAYDTAREALFSRLTELDVHLEGRDYLVGAGRGVLTEADVCLYTTLLRFDPVYHTHFKCNQATIKEHPNLRAFVQRIHQTPGVSDTVRLDHIRGHYYWSHTGLNPYRIVPPGPDMSWLNL